MIRKCEHLGCEKVGICKCPKDRRLAEYWSFCKDHAAEYNKTWNYYAGMTADEINMEWERDMFGDGGVGNADYKKITGDFLTGGSKIPGREKIIPPDVAAALKIFGLAIGAGWEKIQKKYRTLAKEEHPDTGKSKDQSRFAKISAAYRTLKKYHNK
jgi:hypothetical protein